MNPAGEVTRVSSYHRRTGVRKRRRGNRSGNLRTPRLEALGPGATEEIAKEAHVDPSAVMYCDERLDSTFHRLAKTFWRGSYERGMPLKGTEPFDADRFVAIGREVMNRVAAAGNCVIVGRGAPYFLRELPDVFHVFLYAPRSEKLRRLRRSDTARRKQKNSSIPLIATASSL